MSAAASVPALCRNAGLAVVTIMCVVPNLVFVAFGPVSQRSLSLHRGYAGSAFCGAAARIDLMSRAYLFISRVPILNAWTCGDLANSASSSEENEARVHAG